MKIADLFNVLSYRSSDKICVFLVDDYGHLGMSGELTEKEYQYLPGILQVMFSIGMMGWRAPMTFILYLMH